MLVTLFPKSIPVNAVQPENANLPTLVKFSPTSIVVNDPHLSNRLPVMFVTPFGIIILVNDVQSQNVELPILVTLSGMVILAKPLQP